MNINISIPIPNIKYFKSMMDCVESTMIKAVFIMSEIEFIAKNLSTTPPKPCDFSVGDFVTFTNDYGMEFKNRRVIGFSSHLLEHGAFIHLSGTSTPYWMPISPGQLTLERKNSDGGFFF